MNWENRIVGSGSKPADQFMANPLNFRKHPLKQQSAMKGSLDELGWIQQVIENVQTGYLIDGHERVWQALKNDNADVPFIQVDLSPAEEALALASLDPIGAMAQTDKGILDTLLKQIETTNENLTEHLSNFAEENGLYFGEEPEPVDAEPEFDKAEELREKWGVELGQLWKLGEHRLICGDCTDEAVVSRLMDGEKADMVFTDPPYSSGGSQESGKSSGSIGARGGKIIKSDNLSTRGYRLLITDTLQLVRESHSIFIFCDWKMWIETFDLSERAGFRVRNMIVWDKIQMGMGMPFRNQHELILFASKIAGKIGDGKTPNVISCSRDRDAEHNTPKPIELIEKCIIQVDGVYIYDPFLGGGSTLIACENLNRKCRAVELEPKYVAVALERWHQATGKQPELIDG